MAARKATMALIVLCALLVGCQPWHQIVPSYRLEPVPATAHDHVHGPLEPIPAGEAAQQESGADADSDCETGAGCGPLTVSLPRPLLWRRLWDRCRGWHVLLPIPPRFEEEPPEPPWPRFHPVPTRPVFAPVPDDPLPPYIPPEAEIVSPGEPKPASH